MISRDCYDCYDCYDCDGPWLVPQAKHAIIKSMISRESTWHPRYGVSPGYGSVVYNGLQEVFTATATAALESGAMPYAKGVIDNHFCFYVREDGMVWHRTEELPASARMLTVLALYYAYSADASFMLQHFDKARALADLLMARHAASLQYGQDDPRYGIPMGEDEALHADISLGELMLNEAQPRHWYASAAEFYRAAADIGAAWSAIGKTAQRADVASQARGVSRLGGGATRRLVDALGAAERALVDRGSLERAQRALCRPREGAVELV